MAMALANHDDHVAGTSFPGTALTTETRRMCRTASTGDSDACSEESGYTPSVPPPTAPR